MNWHLAQVNIARTKAPFSDPSMTGLTSRIAEMNALAESSPGFVWRFTTESEPDNQLEILKDYFVPFDRDMFFFNMSVWDSIESLQRYAFSTTHRELYRNRHSWVDGFPRAHAALWWSAKGRTPSISDARERLLSVDRNGPTPFAFTFAKTFPAPTDGANN